MVSETIISDDSGDGSYEDKRSHVSFYSAVVAYSMIIVSLEIKTEET